MALHAGCAPLHSQWACGVCVCVIGGPRCLETVGCTVCSAALRRLCAAHMYIKTMQRVHMCAAPASIRCSSECVTSVFHPPVLPLIRVLFFSQKVMPFYCSNSHGCFRLPSVLYSFTALHRSRTVPRGTCYSALFARRATLCGKLPLVTCKRTTCVMFTCLAYWPGW